MSKEKDKDIGLFMLAQLELKQYLEEIKKPSNSYYSKWESLQQFPFLLQAIQTKNLLHHDQENFDFLNEFAKFNSLDYPSISDTYNTIHINFIPKKEEETNSEAEEKTNSEAEINSFEQGFDEFQQNGKLSIENAKVNIDSSLAYKANNPEEMKAHLAKIAEAISKSIYENYFLNSHATNEINKILNSPNSLSFKISEDNGLRYALKIAKKDLRKAKYDPTGGAPIEHIVAELIKDSSKASLIFEKPPLGSQLSRNFRRELAQKPALIELMIEHGNPALLDSITQHKLVYTTHLKDEMREKLTSKLNEKIDFLNRPVIISNDTKILDTDETVHQKQSKDPIYVNYIENPFKELIHDYREAVRSLKHSTFDHNDRTKIKKFMESATSLLKTFIDLNSSLLTPEDKQNKIKDIQKMIKTIDTLAEDNLKIIRKESDFMLKVKANVIQQPNAKDKLETKKLLKAVHYVASNVMKSDETAENHDKQLPSLRKNF